jgi:hypothetical protein
MITTKLMVASKMLGSKLARLFDKAQVIETLGLTEEQNEEFWETQKMTVTTRFYEFLLHRLELPLTTERSTLSDEKAGHLGMVAGHLMHNGLTYKDVRDWWLHEGGYLHKKQFAAKREQDRAASFCIKALFLFEDQKPKYLSYAYVMGIESGGLEGGGDKEFAAIRTPVLLDLTHEKDAHEFPVYSLSELTKESLLEQAKSFETLRKQLGAKEVKLLPKHKVTQTGA